MILGAPDVARIATFRYNRSVRRRFAFATLGTVLLAGCGGGGGSSATGSGEPSPTGSTYTFGPIQTRGQIHSTPITRDLGRITTTALAGEITEVVYRPQGTPDNGTAIAVSLGSSLQMLLDTGEVIDEWRIALPTADEVSQYPKWSPDGQTVYFMTTKGIYSTSAKEPTVATRILNAASGLRYFDLSPDGTKIVYSKVPEGESDSEVFVRDVAGGATKRLTTNADDDLGTVWVDDNRVIIANSKANKPTTNMVRVSDLSSTPYNPPKVAGLYPLGRTTDGRFFLNNKASDPGFGVSVSQRLSDTAFTTRDYLKPAQGNLQGASISPDGQRWAVASPNTGVYTTERFPDTVRVLQKPGPTDAIGVSWQPPLGVTKLVGSGGKLGAIAAGMIVTRRTGPGRSGLASIVTWDGVTRSNGNVSDDVPEPGSGAESFTLEIDRLTSLKVANSPFYQPMSLVSANNTSGSATVTMDASTGLVTSVVVYTEVDSITRGAKPTVLKVGGHRVIEGRIDAVWDGKGHNLAPNGASRVTLDARGAPTMG